MDHLFFLFILSVTLPLAGHCNAYTSLLSWAGWGSSSKVTETWGETTGEISKLSFRGNNPPLLLTYDRKAVGENGKTVSELENNQFYVILDSQPGDQFNFCFRTSPASSTGDFPSLPVFKKPVTGQGMPDMQSGRIRRVASTPDRGRWQHEYSARWRLPAGHQSLVLAIEDNDDGWIIEPECSGIVSENGSLPLLPGSNASANKKISFVDIFYRDKPTEKDGSGHSDDSSRVSGPFAIPGASGTADNSEPFTSSGGGGFGSGDDLGDLFKKRPSGGMGGPLYSFEWMSEQVSRVILVPGTDGQAVKKQIWDARIVLKIKQGWNEQAIIISQELWDKIKAANLERSSGLFLALSRNPDNPEAVFEYYLSSNPPQPLQTEHYRRYGQQAFILSPKQLRSVSVFPGQIPTGISHPGGTGTGQAGSQKGDLNRAQPTQFQGGYGRQNQDSGGGRESGGDDGAGGSSNGRLCQNCNNNKPVLAFNKCKECLDRESGVLEQESTEAQPSAMAQDREEEPVSGTQDADTSVTDVFQWFKALDLNEREREDCFRINHYYNLPALYNLLTQSLMSDKNALSEFYPKWFEFLKGSLSLYHLILQVGELAKTQGIEDYAEVTRIVKTLAIHRDEFESETSLNRFGNELLNQLTGNDFLASDDVGQVFYSGLDSQQKIVLINYIYKIFEEMSRSLKAEIFPSSFLIVIMFNKFGRDVYDRYGFGIPDPYNNRGELTRILKFGFGGEYSFITPSNRNYLTGTNSQSFHDLALNISTNQFIDFYEIETLLTAFVLIRSMHGKRLKDLFYENVRFAEDVSSKQLELLRTFTLKAGEQLVTLLEQKGAEEKDKFIHSMFLIFGMAPGALFGKPSDQSFDELSGPEPVPSTQAVAHVSADPQYQQSEISRRQPATLSPHLEKMMGVCSKLGIDPNQIVERKSTVKLSSTVAQEELLIIASKLGIDWQRFAKQTGVFNEEHLREINKGDDHDKARVMIEKWQKMKGRIIFDDLLEVFAKIGRYDLIQYLVRRYHF
ncbi:death domain-containing protein [Endozoicomonas sp. ALC020]|uniref:death domain-containing protein n=1 Tax=unclassified Endozoicomonas TaxID=2644528 RepID=UPI003BB06BFF